MAYKVDAKKAFNETIEISGRGRRTLKIVVSLGTDALVNKVKPLGDDLMETGKEYNAALGEDESKFKAFTKSLDNMLEFIFGKRAYQKVVKYYGGEYLEMAADLMPFISNCLIPATVKSMSDRARGQRVQL